MAIPTLPRLQYHWLEQSLLLCSEWEEVIFVRYFHRAYFSFKRKLARKIVNHNPFTTIYSYITAKE